MSISGNIEVTNLRINRNIMFLLALGTLLLPFLSTTFIGFQVIPIVTGAALPAPTVTPRILYYTEFADNSLGPNAEVKNTWEAINATHGTDYTRTNLTSYSDLAAELPKHDILLIPEQENASPSNITDIASAWQAPLDAFFADGGIVILMDYWGFDLGSTAQILNETGHFSFSAAYNEEGNQIIVNQGSHPLADGISSFFGPDGTVGFDTSETTLVASADLSGYGVLYHKPMGVGHLVVMGFDFYARDPESDEILENAIRLYQPPSAPALTDPGATIEGFQVPLNWTAATDTDGVIVEYEVQASADAGFAIIGQSATVVTLNHTFIFLTNDTYFFRVRAIDNNTLVGPWSNVVSTYIELPPITLPPGISGFPIEAIVLGLILSLGAIFVLRRRKKQKVSS
jgi:hypothetical protein